MIDYGVLENKKVSDKRSLLMELLCAFPGLSQVAPWAGKHDSFTLNQRSYSGSYMRCLPAPSPYACTLLKAMCRVQHPVCCVPFHRKPGPEIPVISAPGSSFHLLSLGLMPQGQPRAQEESHPPRKCVGSSNLSPSSLPRIESSFLCLLLFWV